MKVYVFLQGYLGKKLIPFSMSVHATEEGAIKAAHNLMSRYKGVRFTKRRGNCWTGDEGLTFEIREEEVE
jgi:hypothetical protein